MDRHTEDLKVLQAGRKKRRISARFFLGVFGTSAAVIIFFLVCAPARTWLLSTKANWESAMGDNAAALADCESALATDSKNAELIEQTAVLLEKNNQDGKAVALWQTLLPANKHTVALAHLSELHIRMKHFDQALAVANDWLKVKPEDYAAWRAHGRALDGLKRYEEAMSDYEKSIALNPKSEAVIDKNELREKQRMQSPTLTLLTDSKPENKPGDYRATVRDAERYAFALEFDKAEELLTRAIDMKPENPMAYLVRARAEYRWHRFQAAENDFAKCEARWKGNEDLDTEDLGDTLEAQVPKSRFYYWRAQNILQLKRFTEALYWNDRAISLNPSRGAYYALRAELLLHLGRREEAAKARALALKYPGQMPLNQTMLKTILIDTR